MDIRTEILRRLAIPNMSNRYGEPYFPTQVRDAVGCREHEFWEVFWALIADGLIYIDPAGQQQAGSWDNFEIRLSQRGIQAATTGRWEPRDPDGYLKRLRRQAPDLEAAAFAYMAEALKDFNTGTYLSCSVMLGVAAEQVFGRLARAYVSARGDAADKLRRLLENEASTYYTRFVELRKRLEPERASLPDGLTDNVTLDAVADLLRVSRNAAGHPTGEFIDADTAYTHLQMAATLLAKMTALARHFEDQAA
jgi:hypothetical protein